MRGTGSESRRTTPPTRASEVHDRGPGEAQRLDLNHVTEQALAAVDDIDQKLAAALVTWRVHHGHFRSWDDVAEVEGVGPEDVAQLQRVAHIGGPRPEPA